jgi:glucan phosphoethanolaminetransferase (alkaline phosphatase superfamily)
VVLVIGESSRYDRWGLNGYGRDTNPLLKEKVGLVALSDVVTAVSSTRRAVPVLLSRKPATQSFRDEFPEKSVLSAFKEAGFKTYWLSNQMTYGKFDTVVSVMAREADTVLFLNFGEFANTPSLDGAMLAPLQAAIADPAPNKLIVLHTLGSHWNYSLRHPKEFDKWKPSLFGVVNPLYTDISIKEAMNNSYDNSILYTDWLLSQVIDMLKTAVPLSALMYVSDHGQTLYDGSCDKAFHGHNFDFEFHIPAFVWYSERYRSAYPDKIEQLHKNRHARLSTENVSHSLADLGDIRFSGEDPERSIFSNRLKRHTRYVDSNGWSTYDNASFQGDCRMVIDKGKPRPRE